MVSEGLMRILVTLFILSLFANLCFGESPDIAAQAKAQIQSIMNWKQSWTPAQQKISSRLLIAAKVNRGEAISSQIPTMRVGTPILKNGMVDVQIKGQINSALEKMIFLNGGTVQESYPQFNILYARVPLGSLESIAASS